MPRTSNDENTCLFPELLNTLTKEFPKGISAGGRAVKTILKDVPKEECVMLYSVAHLYSPELKSQKSDQGG